MLDEGSVTFLLYKGELKSLKEGMELSDEAYEKIIEDILLPRAKKRVLYYLKNADKTEFQIKSKLRDGFYPEEVIDKVMDFLHKYRLSDDERFARSFIEAKSGSYSKREIEAKLYAKGLKGEKVKEILSEMSGEDEYEACEKALRKHFVNDRAKDYAFLARKGYSFDAIEHAISAVYCSDDF
ncbi:MAG: regulatory protein RecX [Eubacteriales bacterium]|nr:regulatory protein RecX [Eubacteriales bacterium]